MLRLDELRQYFAFLAAGIDDLVPTPDDDEDDTPICIECGEL